MYILGMADKEEKQRLQGQAELLTDETLKTFCQNAKRILDIGSGPGTLLPFIRNINKEAYYHGMDIDKHSIEQAKAIFSEDSRASFQMGNVLTEEINQEFDLIISRLFLWSVKDEINPILRKCKNVLQAGGFFYSYEPNDRLLEYFPHKETIDNFLSAWQEACLKVGADPFIGRVMPAHMSECGFVNIRTNIHGVIVSGLDKTLYKKHAANLAKIFLNLNHPYVRNLSKNQRSSIEKELLSFDYRSVIMQNYIVTIGQKA